MPAPLATGLLLAEFQNRNVQPTRFLAHTSNVLTGQAGYRPIALLFAAFFLVSMVLLPVPGSLIGLVEEVNPPGYAMMETDAETIVNSANSRNNPKAFEAWRRSGGSAEAAENLDTSGEVARRP